MEINDIIIRAEKETDRETIHNLVDRIRKTDEYIPELSLAAVYEEKLSDIL